MNNSLIVVDDFYKDPFTVRELALKSTFESNKGSSYFMRTKAYLPFELIQNIEKIFGREIDLADGNWVENPQYNGTFYMLDPNKKPPEHIHHDQHEWVGVICLDTTPPMNKVVVDATCFWTHLSTGRDRAKDIKVVDSLSSQGNNLHAWHLEDVVAHKFNRAIIYPGARFHSARIGTYSRLNQLLAFSLR